MRNNEVALGLIRLVFRSFVFINLCQEGHNHTPKEIKSDHYKIRRNPDKKNAPTISCAVNTAKEKLALLFEKLHRVHSAHTTFLFAPKSAGAEKM